MIKKEDYKKALAIIKEYNEQLSQKIVNNHICCICKENVISKFGDHYINPLKQESEMWLNGTVEKINFGYGSKYDMTSYYIAICDDCMEELIKNDIAINLNNLRKEFNKLRLKG